MGTIKHHKSGCPIAYGLNIFGDRWTLLIIREILLRKNSTFNVFLNGGEGISTNILTDRLKQLERKGIIGQRPSPENRRSNIYFLTKKGADLAPIMIDIIAWSAQYDESTTTKKEVLDKITNDRDNFIKDLKAYHKRVRPK